jgi:hypothetical protein
MDEEIEEDDDEEIGVEEHSVSGRGWRDLDDFFCLTVRSTHTSSTKAAEMRINCRSTYCKNID